MEQEVEMWKNTAKVYKRRYETMRNMAIFSVSFVVGFVAVVLIAIGLRLLLG